jgi:two-component system, OmpR family, response regulator VicR
MAKKILIAEDERPMAKALQLKLTKEGFEAVNAYNGDEALELLDNGKFDLMLLDIMMPNTDGFAVLEALKKKNISLPIIVTSNLSQEEDIAKAKKLGAKDFLVKSDVPINKIVEKVNNLLK